MPLESCMILLDNSQYMRNGDYLPSRLSAQQDAANLLVSHKTSSNPESTVGIIAMNGGCFTRGVELLVSPTDDVGKLLGALQGIPLRGDGALSSGLDVPASVQVASLALKHRRNKNGQQRIVVFVGSPLTEVTSKQLIKAGKTLKKNNVAIDVVAMGSSEYELGENEAKLKELVDAANGANEERSCHLVTIPPGTLPSDVLIASPIVNGGAGGMGMGGAGMASPGGAAGGGGGGADFSEYGGIDPNMDPELAMALRISMEEERARQERIAREEEAKNAEDGAAENAAESAGDTAGNDGDVQMEGDTTEPATATGNSAMGMLDAGDEDAMLQQALAMSMAENQAEAPTTGNDEADDDEDDDAAMQMALAMSMQAEGGANDTNEGAAQFQDPQFAKQLLESMPGVDPNDPSIREALEGLEKTNEDTDKKKKDDEDKDASK